MNDKLKHISNDELLREINARRQSKIITDYEVLRDFTTKEIVANLTGFRHVDEVIKELKEKNINTILN